MIIWWILRKLLKWINKKLAQSYEMKIIKSHFEVEQAIMNSLEKRKKDAI